MTSAILKKIDEMKPREWGVQHGGVTVNGKTRISLAIELAPGDIHTGDKMIPVVEASHAEKLEKALKIALDAMGESVYADDGSWDNVFKKIADALGVGE